MFWPFVITAALTTLGVAAAAVLTQRWHGHYTHDACHGIQKFHRRPTPRVGGLALVAGCLMVHLQSDPETSRIFGPLLLASMPAFVFGLLEDLTGRISPRVRLAATLSSAALASWITGITLTRTGLGGLDLLFAHPLLAAVLGAVIIAGVANSLNIIDGFNGLAAGVALVAACGIGFIASSVGDTSLARCCAALAGATVGFLLLNWPAGRLFLGDGGSYFLGFSCAWCALLLVQRHPELAPFIALLMFIYPVSEVLFSIYRRRARRHPAFGADRLHLHSLVMRRYVKHRVPRRWGNPATGLVMVMLSLPSTLAAWLLRDAPLAAGLACLAFFAGYVMMYIRIVRYRWCLPIRAFAPRRSERAVRPFP